MAVHGGAVYGVVRAVAAQAVAVKGSGIERGDQTVLLAPSYSCSSRREVHHAGEVDVVVVGTAQLIWSCRTT